MRQTIRGVLVACSLALAVAAAGPVAAQSPPTQPAAGTLGGPGPCTEGTGKNGYGNKTEYIFVKVPTGTGSPRTGGTCNDSNRPVILISPGYGTLTPTTYPNLVNDMISNGFIVIFVNYSLYPIRPDVNYEQVWDGYQVATTTFNAQIGNRMDLTNVGIWGHSLGGGMVPWLAKKVSSLGHGSNSFWLTSSATSWAFWVELTGPIDIPSHTRVQVLGFEHDDKADHRVGIDVFHALDVPYSQKDYIMIKSQGSYVADHSVAKGSTPNYLDWYGLHRNYQALADCARFGTNCNADLTYMGTWSNAQPATPAIVSDSPVDLNPPTGLTECGEDNEQGTPSRCGPP